ncbi:MAG: Heavy metal transport/detoxification protein [Lacrimispora sp.]|nr:Heavy metal transport/detoxification protein [Lacrimispora sp.]
MGNAIRTKKLRIGGMTCISCQNKIEKKLRNTAGIEKAEVSYNAGTALVTFDTDIISYQSITGIIENLGGILMIIASLYLFLEQSGLLNVLVPSQLADKTMGYGMLFLIGLITSVHCVAMCGGINLSQCIPKSGQEELNQGRLAAFRPAFLYNLGRVISYTAVGFLAGGLGAAVTFSNTFQGVLKLAAGIFMVIMGINMLGIFPWLRRLNPRMPKFIAVRIQKQKAKSSSPFFVGLLNGLMPCGPLQAMQIYALSTGNPFSGALSMFLFSIGTVPLMFFLGALSTVLSKKFSSRVMTAGAVLVVVLGLSMFTQGVSLAGISPSAILPGLDGISGNQQESSGQIKIEDGVQVINSTLSPGRYPNIKVQAGIPVKWIIDAPAGSINGCNNRMIIREYGIEYSFHTGENVVEFTPDKTGKIPYSCWMGMIRGSINVTKEGETDGGQQSESQGVLKEYAPQKPVPAGYTIPVDDVVVAQESTDENGKPVQKITLELTSQGFKPAVAVVKAGVDTEWTFIDNRQDMDYGTNLLIPDFTTELYLEKGENTLYFIPDKSFDFSTGDNSFYGYIKVVDDLENVDLDAVKDEVSKFQTMIWPEDTFQGSGGSCCG